MNSASAIMICRNCLRAAARARSIPPPSSNAPRFLSNSTSRRNAVPIDTTATRQDSESASHTRPAATSTSAPQPLGEPLAPSAKPEKPKQAPIVKSSVPAGTRLTGLNFLKNKEDPIALADDEYPSWLWDILKSQEKKGEAAAEGDLFSKSKKQRRLAAKRLRKEQLANPSLLHPKVPIYEQTIDLPAGDGTVKGAIQAAGAREQLTKALRNKRRANIKEANFLKAMG